MSKVEQLEATILRRKEELRLLEIELFGVSQSGLPEDLLYQQFLFLQKTGIEKHLCQLRYEIYLSKTMSREPTP